MTVRRPMSCVWISRQLPSPTASHPAPTRLCKSSRRRNDSRSFSSDHSEGAGIGAGVGTVEDMGERREGGGLGER